MKELGALKQGYEEGNKVEGVWALGVHLNKNTQTTDGVPRTTEVLRLSARVTRPKKEFNRLRVELAQTVLTAMPEFPSHVAVKVELQTGIQFGYFNTTTNDSKTLAAGQWRAMDPEKPTAVPEVAQAVYGLSPQEALNLAKNAQARINLGTTAKSVLVAYEVSVGDGADLEERKLPPSGAAIPETVPGANPVSVHPAVWDQAGWSDIDVELEGPLNFSYSFDVAPDGGSFVASARGDFDEDGVESILSLGGHLGAKEDGMHLIFDDRLGEINLGE